MSRAVIIFNNPVLNGVEVDVLSKVPLENKDVFLVKHYGGLLLLEENNLEFLDTKPVTQLEAFINNMNNLASNNTVESPFIQCAANLAKKFKENRGYGYEKI